MFRQEVQISSLFTVEVFTAKVLDYLRQFGAACLGA